MAQRLAKKLRNGRNSTMIQNLSTKTDLSANPPAFDFIVDGGKPNNLTVRFELDKSREGLVRRDGALESDFKYTFFRGNEQLDRERRGFYSTDPMGGFVEGKIDGPINRYLSPDASMDI